MDREALAWAAGFLDGEGHVNCGHGLVVTVHQRERELLDRMATLFGGSVRSYTRQNGRSYWQWSVSSLERVQATVAMVWPWLGSYRRAQTVGALRKYDARSRQSWGFQLGNQYGRFTRSDETRARMREARARREGRES